MKKQKRYFLVCIPEKTNEQARVGAYKCLLFFLLLTLLWPTKLANAAISDKKALLSHASSTGPICKSVQCKLLAADMMKKMNTSADPCQDFYNYACGNFRNMVKYDPETAFNQRLPRDYYLFQDAFDSMERRLKGNVYEMLVLDNVATSANANMSDLYNFTRLFFRSCSQWMRQNDDDNSQFSNYESSIVFLKDVFRHLVQEIGPSVDGGQRSTLEFVLATLVKSGADSMLRVTLPIDFAENVLLNNYNLTGIPRAVVDVNVNAYSKNPDLRPYLLFFTRHKISAPLMFARQANKFATIIEELKIGNGNDSWAVDGCSVLANQSYFTVRELDELSLCSLPETPFSWRIFFQELLQTEIEEEAVLRIPDPIALVNFVSYFKSRPVYGREGYFSEHVSLLVLDWLFSFAEFFPKELLQTWRTARIREVQLQRPNGDIVDGCMVWTRRFLQPIVERMYQTAYHPGSFESVKLLIKAIQNSSVESIRAQTWITDSAKEAIIRKVQSVDHSIGFDELSADELTSFYATTLQSYREANFIANMKDSFGSLMSMALCAHARKNFDVMSGSSPVTIFLELNPLIINAFNFLEKNQIIFPMAILEPPVYHVEYPPYINLGSLGYIIGHEIGHSFDNKGHEVNQQGGAGHFWDNETEAAYLERTECVRRGYGQYRLYPGGPTHYSNSSLGNDIADIIGIKAAIGALRLLQSTGSQMPLLPSAALRSLQPEQLFFIQAAQSWCFKSEPNVLSAIFGKQPSHSPHHLRVRGIADNSREFAQAFGCQSGPSSSEDRCEFW